MCRSVLNDEWVCHPTWTSEDSGFIAHKKNIYEEALHRSEEERHEYDFHIEAITRTISNLEPINNKIAQMNAEDRGTFKLKPNLGGTWKAIHQRVIKKIYGREPGLDVIQSMQDTPALAIPVVLQRLKQKEEEWKRAQREWNKVWREVDARNYAKSLDHQSITFKAADKKAITTKALVSQIEAAREEQMAARASLIDPLFSRTRPRHQLDFVMDDVPVIQDAMKLTFSFLDRTQAQINFAERRRIEGLLRSFIPLFFTLDPVSFNAAFSVSENGESEGSDADNLDEAESISIASSSKLPAGRGAQHQLLLHHGRKNPALSLATAGGDLRKKLLKSEQAKSSRKTRAHDASPAGSRPVSPALLDEDMKAASAGDLADSIRAARRNPRRYIFFTNTAFYVLIRLLQVFELFHFLDVWSCADVFLLAFGDTLIGLQGPKRTNSPRRPEIPTFESGIINNRPLRSDHE
jgi:paired amphipathic helix protein Sin3a